MSTCGGPHWSSLLCRSGFSLVAFSPVSLSQLHAPLVADSSLPSLVLEGDRAFTSLQLDRVHAKLGIDESTAHLVINEVAPSASTFDSASELPSVEPQASSSAAYEKLCITSCQSALDLGADRIVAFGDFSRTQWLAAAPILADQETKALTALEQETDVMHLTHKGMQRTVIFAPHPADRAESSKLHAALLLAHRVLKAPVGAVSDLSSGIDRITACKWLTQESAFDVSAITIEPKLTASGEEVVGSRRFLLATGAVTHNSGDRDSSGGQFGREAIDTIMKHLDPPSVVFIFAGYEKPMEDFLRVNEGLARRIPYRYQFDPYNTDQLCQIFRVMCESKGEILEYGVAEEIPHMLHSLDEQMLSTQNAGLISNWLSFAQGERDDRVDIDGHTPCTTHTCARSCPGPGCVYHQLLSMLTPLGSPLFVLLYPLNTLLSSPMQRPWPTRISPPLSL